MENTDTKQMNSNFNEFVIEYEEEDELTDKELLLEYCRYNEIENLIRLLNEQNIDINSLDEQGNTGLRKID